LWWGGVAELPGGVKQIGAAEKPMTGDLSVKEGRLLRADNTWGYFTEPNENQSPAG